MRRLLASAFVLLTVLFVPAAALAASTTIVISEFRTRGPNGANDEFVELFNVSAATVNIGGYTLMASDSNGVTTVLAQAPPTFTLLSKHFYLFVNVGTQGYSGTTGPNTAYTIGIPDNGGIGILNKSGVVIDAVGMSVNSAYTEGTPLPPLTASVNQSYERDNGGCAATVDTDDNLSDFRFNPISSGPANSNATCVINPCSGIVCKAPQSSCFANPGVCVAGACTYAPFAPGAACNDGNACTVGDLCDGSQNCISGATNPCNTPPAASCTDSKTLVTFAAVGTCSTTAGCSYASTTTNCPFGCNGTTKACNADPCTSVSCTTAPNDCYQAGSGTCVNGACQFTTLPSTTACDDKNPCTGSGACDGAGKCVAGAPTPVDDGEACTVDACNATTGAVTHTAVADTTNCDDGDLCNGIATCSAGKCTNGAPKACTTPPIGGCYAATGTCTPSNGACAYQPSSPTTTCDDGNACTTADKCDGNGVCGGSAVICAPAAPTCFDVNTSRTFTAGACQAGAGDCSVLYTDKHCDFGCDANAGLCAQDPCIGIACNTPPNGCYQTAGTCSGGKCNYTVTADAACDDGDPCTSNDKCSGAGACTGTPLACNTPDVPKCTDSSNSTSYNPAGTCSNATCSYTATPTACSFGCDATSGLCVGDPCKGITCDAPPDQCHQTNGTCGADGKCSYSLKAEGSTCDDGKPCTTSDTCDAAGKCSGQTACNQPPAPTCDATTVKSHAYDAAGTCDTSGACAYTASDKTCAAGCDTTGLCKNDPCATMTCATPPAGGCYNATGTCSNGNCAYAPRDTTATCDDGNDGTTDDHCDGSGKCAGTAGPDGGEDAGHGGKGTGGKSGAGGATSAGGSTSTGGASSGGTPSAGGGTSALDAGTGGKPGPADAGTGVDSGTPSTISGGGSGSCGCSVPRKTTGTAWPLGLLALSMLAMRRRRR
jgi:MYXO-CTERM domain-containing protein